MVRLEIYDMWFWNELISGSKVFKHENFSMFVMDGKRDPVHMFTLRWIIQHRLSVSLNSQGKLVYIIVCSVAMISLCSAHVPYLSAKENHDGILEDRTTLNLAFLDYIQH